MTGSSNGGYVNVSGSVYGANGGSADTGNGGNGASETLTNAISGSTEQGHWRSGNPLTAETAGSSNSGTPGAAATLSSSSP